MPCRGVWVAAIGDGVGIFGAGATTGVASLRMFLGAEPPCFFFGFGCCLWGGGGGGGGGGDWQVNHAYHVGDVVTFNGHSYKCLQAHTSLPGWEPPNVPALWQAL